MQNARFVKILAWYSQKEKRIKTFMIDTEDSDGKSTDCAQAVQHSLRNFFGREASTAGMLKGQTTDSGGGGGWWHWYFFLPCPLPIATMCK
jgi:hypothetical protein